MDVKDSIQFLKGVGETRAKQLAKLGLFTVEDLLRFYPRGYIDYNHPYPVAMAPYEGMCVVKATVYGKQLPMRIRGGRTIYRVTAGDDTAGLLLTFFNSPYAARGLEENRDYLFYGRVGGALARREMVSPTYVPADGSLPMTPVYHLTEGVNSKYIVKLVGTALTGCGAITDPLPEVLRQKYRLPDLRRTLEMIHTPKNEDEVTAARRRLVFEELYYLQLGMKLMRSINMRANRAVMANTDLTAFYNALPFTPTGAQQRAITEIASDLCGKTPMNRLLQGDVGSGKTLVAAAAMVIAAQNGFQSVLMAPTEILAQQHANTLQGMLRPLGIEVALLTGSVRAKPRRVLLEAISTGAAQVVVGTHAVLSDDVIFHRLGFAVTDEQHRFGVRQRGLLAAKAESPHLLVMSATPIPRTLSLLLFGELDVSILDELPPGRTPIKTYAVTTALRGRMFGFLEKQIEAGRQVFIVCPLIDESDGDSPAAHEMQAVTTYFEEVAKQFLPHRRIGLMHGRLRPTEKAQVMQQFASGELDVICSTTVIEVGVDVPNASVMVIENAERYGLSALHQLRGRVGRGAAESFCILVSDHDSEEVHSRLALMCHTNDGFAVAQYDLEHRGPGDFFGERQHGLPRLKVADAMQDARVLETAAAEAATLLSEDSKLTAPKNAPLRHEVEKLFELGGGLAIN